MARFTWAGEWDRPAPSVRGWHFLGGLALFLFLIEVLSGILLMVYYRPSPEAAYESVRFLMSRAHMGWLVRGIHKWAADLLILMVLGHLLRVYFQGAYRGGRELNWIVGVLLLLLVGAFAFTGSPLVWDQSAFWGTEAIRKVIARVPLLGPVVLDLLWGGRELKGEALLRFYVFHVGLLPWLMVALLLGHLYLVARQGLFPTNMGRNLPNNGARSYIDVLLDGLLAVLFVSGVLLTLAVLLAPTLGEQADPLKPEAASFPWYLLPAYGLLKTVPRGWGLLLIVLFTLLILSVPFLDRRVIKRRWIARLAGVVATLGLISLGILGYLWGGP